MLHENFKIFHKHEKMKSATSKLADEESKEQKVDLTSMMVGMNDDI